MRVLTGASRLYRAFLIDADNTIFDYDRSETESLAETLVHAGYQGAFPAAQSAYRQINGDFWHRLERGKITMETLKWERFRELARALALTADPRDLSSYYIERLGSKFHFRPHAYETLQALSRGASLCLVTNGITRVQKERIARAGIAPFFRHTLISEEIGIAKPDPRFFLRALSELGTGPDGALCVGDNLSSDIGGAKSAGIDACWYAPLGGEIPAGQPVPDYIISDLQELTDFIV
jgi:YjjG family noncanonical pyrimidine nucleotidase